MTTVDHAACSFAGREVRCERCRRTYVCTPSDDYYCTPEGDHCCEQCLTAGQPISAWALIIRAPGPMRTTNNARRLHWSKTSAERRDLRHVVQAEARGRLPKGLRRVRVDIRCHFTDRARRDASNLHDQVGKPIVDALGPARTVKDRRSPSGWRVEPGHGLIPNDDQQHLDGPHITIGEPVDKRRWPFGRITVTITDLSGGDHA